MSIFTVLSLNVVGRDLTFTALHLMKFVEHNLRQIGVAASVSLPVFKQKKGDADAVAF